MHLKEHLKTVNRLAIKKHLKTKNDL